MAMENGINEESLKLFVEGIKKEREQKEKINKLILHDDKYINSVIKELKKYGYLHSMGSGKYISLLPHLYRIVNVYAKTNNLCPIIFKNYSIYYINYNGYIFSIFRESIDDNIEFGCYPNYLKEEQIPYYIDFNDIKNNREITINEVSNGLIKKVYDAISELNEEGLSVYFINDIVNSICDDLENKEKKLLKK